MKINSSIKTKKIKINQQYAGSAGQILSLTQISRATFEPQNIQLDITQAQELGALLLEWVKKETQNPTKDIFESFNKRNKA